MNEFAPRKEVYYITETEETKWWHEKSGSHQVTVIIKLASAINAILPPNDIKSSYVMLQL